MRSVLESCSEVAVLLSLSRKSVCVVIALLSFATIGCVKEASSGWEVSIEEMESRRDVYASMTLSIFLASVRSVSATAETSLDCVSKAESKVAET